MKCLYIRPKQVPFMTGFDDQVFMNKQGTRDGLNDRDSLVLTDIENTSIPRIQNNNLSIAVIIRIMWDYAHKTHYMNMTNNDGSWALLPISNQNTTRLVLWSLMFHLQRHHIKRHCICSSSIKMQNKNDNYYIMPHAQRHGLKSHSSSPCCIADDFTSGCLKKLLSCMMMSFLSSGPVKSSPLLSYPESTCEGRTAGLIIPATTTFMFL